MSDVPDDIREEAAKIAKEAIFYGSVEWAADDIAAVLMAERNR